MRETMGSLRDIHRNPKKTFQVAVFIKHVQLRLDDTGRITNATIMEGPDKVFGTELLCRVKRLGGFVATIPTDDIGWACSRAKFLYYEKTYGEVEFYLEEALNHKIFDD
jgi:hypothetical protein